MKEKEKKELLASLYSDYRAYAEPSLIFVLKYADNTKYNTFKYHLDGASYTYNIALNNDFTGGGLDYRMGNRYFGEEKEFHVPHNRTGWAVIQPNRPLHVHRGVPLESGTRYAMINIIETNDAGSKGGPAWIMSS
ncbi:Procollagen-lysine,2-oxoglutarate 5-dioxygenase 3 precursor [Penaeus vannamei]|uniref:Procollagen-lysine,2-oxoglutarate 5-dioxygenase 3 n=1 Tax=Penaeus vannamei TaxID=6689 RepID=A0A3R7M333_PENVA|nr:Procollagen-lysine,2-oxoglutarate 5-dioxygenase 3 precursor [Penaeus vannamei]